MTNMAVAIYGEGCLDIALGYHIVLHSSELDTRIIETDTRRGWQDTIGFVIRQLERFISNDGLSPKRIIVFIDADYSLIGRLNEIRAILSSSKLSDLIELREVYPEFNHNPEDLSYPLGLELSLKGRQDVNVLIVLWAVKKDNHDLSGTVEDVIRTMLFEAYGCSAIIHNSILGDLANCSECPNRASKMISTFEKLMTIVLLASCAGTGTLVSVHGIDSADSTSSHCGLPVLDALEKLDNLNSTSTFQRYSLLIRKFLSRE